MTILVTGGAGYIGSHTCVELIAAGHSPVVIDNFCNASAESVKRVEKITGKKIKLYEGDVRDAKLLDRIFSENKIDSVIHFAGLKAVGESCAKPIEYYDNNLVGTLVLLDSMRRHGCKKIVFSSSATVYGTPCRSTRSAKRAARPIRTARASIFRKSCCATFSRPTTNGRWCCLGTSTPSARTRAAR